MPFWKCYYHIIWATKHHQPLITSAHEEIIFTTIRQISDDLKCETWAINAVSDHVHSAISIPPAVSVAEWVKQCKGASSRMVNQMLTLDDYFSWQAGYRVLTFGQNVLPFVVAYINKPKQHHSEGSIQPYLEQLD